MGTTAEKLQNIINAKADIGAAITEKGGTVPEKLMEYGDAIRSLPSGGGVGKSLAGETVEPISGSIVTAGEGAEIFNDYRERVFSGSSASEGNIASGKFSHAEGKTTTAMGECSHAEGNWTQATSICAHAEGMRTNASSYYAHAEGVNTLADGMASHAEGSYAKATSAYAHAEGQGTTAAGDASHAEGRNTTANALYSHAEGVFSTAIGMASHAEGEETKASARNQHVCGKFNVEHTDETSRFIIGMGSNDSSRANCFRVTDTGTFASGSYNASGADYAELFEWADGNPKKEDRAGRFVTLTGDKIRLATAGDDFILGVISGNPSIVGDVHDDQWAGMYLYDVFGRPIWEDVEVPDKTVEEPDPENLGKTVTRVVIPAHIEHRQKLNPAYDGTQQYKARSERHEWDAVGLMGKLVAVDDGTCEVDGWCKVGENGTATASQEKTKFRVMKRLDDTHIRIMILP